MIHKQVVFARSGKLVEHAAPSDFKDGGFFII